MGQNDSFGPVIFLIIDAGNAGRFRELGMEFGIVKKYRREYPVIRCSKCGRALHVHGDTECLPDEGCNEPAVNVDDKK